MTETNWGENQGRKLDDRVVKRLLHMWATGVPMSTIVEQCRVCRATAHKYITVEKARRQALGEAMPPHVTH